MVLGKRLDCVGCHGLFFYLFFSNLSSFFIIFPGEGKEEKKEWWWILPPRQEKRTFEKRYHLQIAALVNSTKCQGIPGKGKSSICHFNHLVWFFSECHLTSGSALSLQNRTSSAMHAAWSVLHTTILEKQAVVVFRTLWELNNYVNFGEKQKKSELSNSDVSLFTEFWVSHPRISLFRTFQTAAPLYNTHRKELVSYKSWVHSPPLLSHSPSGISY